MHIVRVLSQIRSRRAVLATSAALFGCAMLGAVSLGIASAEQTPAQPVSGVFVERAEFDELDSGQFKQQRDKFINTLASKLGVSSDKLQQALTETQKEVGPVPLLLGDGAGVVGTQGFTISISSDHEIAAKALGINQSQLRQELSHKSLTDVARAHNIDPQTVANAIKSARIADLDKAVQSGKAPADMVNRIKSNLDKEVDMLMAMVRSANGGPGEPDVRIFGSVSGEPVMKWDTAPGR